MITSKVVPYWFDDVSHSLVVYQIHLTGLWAYPKNYPYITDYEIHSTMITIGPVLHYLASFYTKITGWNFYHLRIFMCFLNAFFPILIFQISSHFFQSKSKIWAVILFIFNLHFLVYGSQYIGEVFMMECLLLGIYFQFQAILKLKKYTIIYSQIFFYLAILTKEYIALIIGLYLLTTWIFGILIYKRFFSYLFWQGLLLPLPSLVFYIMEFNSIYDFIEYWNSKKDYQKEFFDFNPANILWIIKKPLVLIGYCLIILKVIIRKKIHDIFLFFLQTLLISFFLLGVGFDRFGFWLIPVSILYIAEWLAFIWDFIVKTILSKIFFIVVLLIMIFQNTVNPFYWYYMWQKNEHLKSLALMIQNSGIHQFFTYEVEIIPYMKEIQIETTSTPPISSSRIKTKIRKKYFLVGSYAQTEYTNTYKWEDYTKIWEFKGYQMWKLKD